MAERTRRERAPSITIPSTDIGTINGVLEGGIKSIDPDGSQYPAILRFITSDPKNEDPASLLSEARSVGNRIGKMKFTLLRDGVLYHNIFVRLPKLQIGSWKDFFPPDALGYRRDKPYPIPFGKYVQTYYLDRIIMSVR